MANNYYGIPVGQPAQYTAAATPYPAQYTATPIVGQTRSDQNTALSLIESLVVMKYFLAS